MSKTEELLKVLDMPEEEQWEWVTSHQTEYDYQLLIPSLLTNEFRQALLADLAFRLRNSVEDHKRSRHIIYRHLVKSGKVAKLCCGCCYEPWWDWWINTSKPIHWIIAALIAKKEKADADKD